MKTEIREKETTPQRGKLKSLTKYSEVGKGRNLLEGMKELSRGKRKLFNLKKEAASRARGKEKKESHSGKVEEKAFIWARGGGKDTLAFSRGLKQGEKGGRRYLLEDSKQQDIGRKQSQFE